MSYIDWDRHSRSTERKQETKRKINRMATETVNMQQQQTSVNEMPKKKKL